MNEIPRVRRRCRLEDSIKMDLQEVIERLETGFPLLSIDLVTGFYDHGNEPPCYILN
jgi:hypothetical protein